MLGGEGFDGAGQLDGGVVGSPVAFAQLVNKNPLINENPIDWTIVGGKPFIGTYGDKCESVIPGRFTCKTDEATVVFSTTVDDRSGDGLPFGIVTAFFNAPDPEGG